MSDDYDGFDGLVDEVVKKACLAELYMNGWVVNPDGSVSYALSGLGGGDLPPVAGPGQGYPDDPLAPNGNASPGSDGQLQDPSTTVGQVYRNWESQIPPVFEPLRGLADPDQLQTLADNVRTTLEQLSSSGSTGSSDSSDPGAGAANLDYVANTTLGLADQVAQKLNDWDGNAATAFAEYLNLFKGVVANQALACEVLRCTLLMEKEMHTRLRSDAVAFAKAAAGAFGEVGAFSVDDVKAILSVAGTVNDVLGWFPALAPASAAAGKGLMIGDVIVNSLGGAKDKEENDLAGGGCYDVLKRCQDHSEKLVKDSQTVEGDIQQSLENLAARINERPAARPGGGTDQQSFRLARPQTTFDADSVDDFVYGATPRSTPEELRINPQTIYQSANQLGDELAPEMATAGKKLDDSDSAGPWYRSGSEIGVGSWGAYSEYSAASTLLQHEIEDTAHEMEWAAEMLRAVADDLTAKDDDVSDDFDAVRTKVDRYDNPPPVVPDYSNKPMPTPY